MNVTYGRISTAEQNENRQTTKGYKSFIDTCSGSVPFMERPKAKELIKFLKNNSEVTVNIIAVDRLGRNTLDILQTVQFFKANNFNLRIENLGMDTTSPFFDMMVSIMGTLAEQEKKTIAERCKQGIEIAKAEGLYTGRKTGTTDTRKKTLEKHSDIVLCLKKNMNVNETAKLTKKTRVTVYKVKALMYS
jgi:DNA invertase Pin-like site-specific DNA recombinase